MNLREVKTPLLPKEDRVWEPNNYVVLASSPGVIRIQHGTTLLYADISELQGGACGKDDPRHCVYFPNGQSIYPDTHLLPLLPVRATWKMDYGQKVRRSFWE